MNAELNAASCQCGAAIFEVRAALASATRYNCSLCRHALTSPQFSVDELQIIDKTDVLMLNQSSNTHAAQHFFCKVCGVYAFDQTRKDPQVWRINLGCPDGANSCALESKVADGNRLSVMEEA